MTPPVTQDLSDSFSPAHDRSDLERKVYPDDLRNKEHAFLGSSKNGKPEPVVGLALSGGGIRSATFCLGFLQSLARHDLLSKIRYLSTVSGGGYIGGFLGALYSRCRSAGAGSCPLPAEDAGEKVKRLLEPDSFPLSWLRENGRYLAPNNSGDLVTALGVQLRNWASVLLVMGLLLSLPFLAAEAVRGWLENSHGSGDWLNRTFVVPNAGEFWWLSPLLLVSLLPLYAGIAVGWAYWLIPRFRDPWFRRPWLPHVGTIALGLGVLIWTRLRWDALEWAERIVLFLLTILPLVAFAIWAINWFLAFRQGANFPNALSDEKVASDFRFTWQRGSLTRWFSSLMIIAAVSLGFALLDSAGQSLYAYFHQNSFSLKAFLAASGLSVVLSLGPKVVPLLQGVGGNGPRMSLMAIGSAAGFAALLFFLLALNLAVHALAWMGGNPAEAAITSARIHSSLLWAAFFLALFLSILIQCAPSFLHTSSLQMLYGFRLARAYLGASNPLRKDPKNRRVTDMIPGDDAWLDEYQPHRHGGPMHLINLTFNETCSAMSNIEQRDRKGLQFAVGPFGLSVGTKHHALWTEARPAKGAPPGATPGITLNDEQIQPIPLPAHNPGSPVPFAIFPQSKDPGDNGVRSVESISVGHWIALSGAAFGCGLGSRTRLGLSLLTGLANLRIGYWWNSHIRPRERPSPSHSRTSLSQWIGRAFARAFRVQSYLLDEWLARFHGPARVRWYLSDGGHFENTALYELIRRRVPYIICCDCGEDSKYQFADVANLVRKARIDFQAEVAFVCPAHAQEAFAIHDARGRRRLKKLLKQLGTPEDFQSGKGAKVHGLLATVKYEGSQTPGSLILFAKPVLSGDEPLDVAEYRDVHAEFPHESTADQFFDEAQWESYRKLGEHSAEQLLGPMSELIFHVQPSHGHPGRQAAPEPGSPAGAFGF